MCKLVEDYAEQKHLESLYEAVSGAMESFKITVSQAMDALKISESDKIILAKLF